MRQLTFAQIEQIRQTPGESLLLFITDRCPVGCAHCSVDSRQDSPTITDFDLFENIVQGICAQPQLKIVGISGGEPFVERRGLELAVNYLSEANKDIVLYTSGIWANSTTPTWIQNVISKTSCVFLSTDAFHADRIDDERYIRAARTIADTGVWIVVQVINVPEMVEKADAYLKRAFGMTYSSYAEIHLMEPLAVGRGARVFLTPKPQTGMNSGRCITAASQVIRYDGIMNPCCNEGVIMGQGPGRFHVQCNSTEDVTRTLAQFKGDRVLTIMNQVGAGALTHHPRFAELAQRRFSGICQLCWAIQERCSPEEANADPLLGAMASLPHMVSLTSKG